MAASSELNRARQNLSKALGDAMSQYLHNLKLWFKQKLSREDFDFEARKMLTIDAVHLHNEFLLAILTKCQSLGSTLVPKDMNSNTTIVSTGTKLQKKGNKFKKRLPVRTSFQQRFQPVDPLLQAPIVECRPPEEQVNLSFCLREMSLPDSSMIHGRLYVGAWDLGLEDVQDETVKLVMYAVEMHLKNIISAVISRRKGYKVREGRFRHSVGNATVHPYIRNSIATKYSDSDPTAISSHGFHIPSIKPTIEMGQGDAAKQLACAGEADPPDSPISLYDLFDTLQGFKCTIPSHTVYTLCIERIISKLWHPSVEDLQQEHIHRQEVAIRLESAS